MDDQRHDDAVYIPEDQLGEELETEEPAATGQAGDGDPADDPDAPDIVAHTDPNAIEWCIGNVF